MREHATIENAAMPRNQIIPVDALARIVRGTATCKAQYCDRKATRVTTELRGSERTATAYCELHAKNAALDYQIATMRALRPKRR